MCFYFSGSFFPVEVSYNLVNLSSCAKWETNGIIFGETSAGDLLGSSLFIDKNNTVYVIDQNHQRLIEWRNGNDSNPTTQIFKVSFIQSGLFVFIQQVIYILVFMILGQ